jgi:hypothetical protein
MRGNPLVVVPVRPPDVDRDEDPRGGDDARADQDAQAEPRHDGPGEQVLVEGDEQDEAEVYGHHREREDERHAPARGRESVQALGGSCGTTIDHDGFLPCSES